MRNYNYILTIILYPFILILSYFLLSNRLKGDFYLYLLLIMIFIFIPSFIMSLYHASEEILNSKSKWRIILLILFSLFYLPIYYTKYVSNQEKYLGFIISIIGVVFSYLAYQSFNQKLLNFLAKAYENYVVIDDNYVYVSNNNLFKINVSKDFRCNSDDIGDYVIYCDKLDDDSFIGVYSYDISLLSEEEIQDILEYHINQTEEYIKENNYTSEIDKENNLIRIMYNNMVVLLAQENYVFDDDKYSLIIIKEMPKVKEDIEEFKKMIATIYFLNYNEGESS